MVNLTILHEYTYTCTYVYTYYTYIKVVAISLKTFVFKFCRDFCAYAKSKQSMIKINNNILCRVYEFANTLFCFYNTFQ